MSFSLVLVTCAGLLLAPDDTQAAAPPPASKDPAAVVLLERATGWMGGRGAYDRVRYLRFRYEIRDGIVSKSRRDVLWDKKADRVRFEMETSRGTLVVLLDLKEKQGVAFENGEEVPEADQAAVVNRAYGYVLNDLRWLALPWLATDPTAEVRLGAPLERDGVVSERVEVRLDGDVYRLLVDGTTGEIRGWEWKPAAMPAEQPALEFTWEAWTDVAGVKWSTERHQVGGIQRIVYSSLEAPAKVGDVEFEKP